MDVQLLDDGLLAHPTSLADCDEFAVGLSDDELLRRDGDAVLAASHQWLT